MYRYTQHSFVGGQLDRGLMGRQDLERYFQGASVLDNFLVRKQGNITKRRGTEMIADLADLFGTGEAIAYSRIIPFAQDISGGYYVLLAESTAGTNGCFIISDDGIQHKKTTTKTKLDENGNDTDDQEILESHNFLPSSTYTTEETQEIKEIKDENGNIVSSETWRIETQTTPVSIKTPYLGSEFNEVGYNQSGDTLFFVHKNHPPAKLTNTQQGFVFSELNFAAQKWARPSIVSVTKNKIDTTGGASRTISYVCTYVKDGIESIPSEPYQMTFNSPWASIGVATITCSKGDNTEEPDFYNVYKKTSSEYGLISTVGASQNLILSPEVTTASGENISIDPAAIYYGPTKYGNINNRETINFANPKKIGDFLNNIPDNCLTPRNAYVNERYIPAMVLYGIGGVKAPSGVKFNFGDNSGQIISKITVALDSYPTYAYPLNYELMTHYILHRQAGTRFRVRVYASKTSDGVQKEVYNQYINVASCSNTETEHTHELETTWFKADAGFLYTITDWYLKARESRLLSVDFGDSLKKAFNNTTQGYQVNSIIIEPVNDANTVTGDFYFSGVTFSSTIGASNILEDDYITPNLAYTPPQETPHFDKSGNYPACVAMYTQRLAFAATTLQPFTWWMSCVGDLYNFNTHATIRQDDAMEVTVPATEFPNINHMVLSRDLVLFCDNGEWIVRPLSGNTLAYDTVECKKQSAIGCAKSIPPLQVGDELIFTDNSKRVIRSIKYQFTSDGYESSDLSILSQSMFFSSPVVSMCYKQHPESIILCELSDGTVAALVYMKEHNVVAWTHHTLGGEWKCRGIASNKAHADETTHVAILAEHPNGGIEVWRVRDDDESDDLASQLCMDGLRFALGNEIGESVFSSEQMVIDLSTGEEVTSHSLLTSEGEYAIGFPFTAKFISVRPEPQGANATIQWELKNAKAAHVRTLNGSSFSIKALGLDDSYSTHVSIPREVEDGVIEIRDISDSTGILFNGGNSRDGRIEIRHDGVLPITIESFSVDYEIQPLSECEG